jgi:hypothetical protein
MVPSLALRSGPREVRLDDKSICQTRVSKHQRKTTSAIFKPVHPDAQEAYECLLVSDINAAQTLEENLQEIEELAECNLLLHATNDLIHENDDSESESESV